MSELINNAKQRRDLLKHLIQQLHNGEAPDAVRNQLARLLGEVPYHEVVAVEQELIAEGMPTQEVLSFCDLHSAALRGKIDQTGSKTPAAGTSGRHLQKGEPCHRMGTQITGGGSMTRSSLAATDAQVTELLPKARIHFNALSDVDKHYRRKENLLFPFLEKARHHRSADRHVGQA